MSLVIVARLGEAAFSAKRSALAARIGLTSPTPDDFSVLAAFEYRSYPSSN